MAQMFLEWHDDRWIVHTSMETLRAFDLHVEFDSNFTILHHGERSWLVPCPIRMTYRADFTRWYWPNPIAMKETLQDWDRLYLLQESIESAMKSNEYFGWKLQGCQMEQCFTFADCGISFNAVMFNASVWLSRIIRLFAGVLGIVFFVDVIAVGRRMFVLAFRRSRSQCIECGYQLLAGQRQCPECGAQVVLETNRE